LLIDAIVFRKGHMTRYVTDFSDRTGVVFLLAGGQAGGQARAPYGVIHEVHHVRVTSMPVRKLRSFWLLHSERGACNSQLAEKKDLYIVLSYYYSSCICFNKLVSLSLYRDASWTLASAANFPPSSCYCSADFVVCCILVDPVAASALRPNSPCLTSRVSITTLLGRLELRTPSSIQRSGTSS
jgi:hypothetical protein